MPTWTARGWAAAALKCASRARWIGWLPTRQWHRLNWIANNSRVLLLPGERVPNLASRILDLTLARLSTDWQVVQGQRLLLAETFIDSSRVRGPCDRAANWIAVGATRGGAKSNDPDVAHGASKRIWVFPLHRHARLILSSPLPHPALPHQEVKPMTRTEADAPALVARLEQLDDPRGTRGRRHAQRSLVATLRCAVVRWRTGRSRAPRRGAAAQPRDAAAARRRLADGRDARPSDAPLRRMLGAVDRAPRARQLGDGLRTQSIADEAVALDGKTFRGLQQTRARPTLGGGLRAPPLRGRAPGRGALSTKAHATR